MAKFKNFRARKPYGRYGRKKRPVSATRKAYLAGLKAGRRMARSKRRWYRW